MGSGPADPVLLPAGVARGPPGRPADTDVAEGVSIVRSIASRHLAAAAVELFLAVMIPSGAPRWTEEEGDLHAWFAAACSQYSWNEFFVPVVWGLSDEAPGCNATKLSADLGTRWMPSLGLPFDGVCFTVRVGCFSILGGLAEWCVVVDLVVGVGVVRVRVW